MLKDFVVADAVGIQMGGEYVDLHNEFDLAQIRIRPSEHTVELEFVPVSVSPTAPAAPLVLQFLDVDWIQISPHALLGDRDISELGYKEPSDHDHDWLLREEQASPEAHFFLRLSGDEFVRLHGRRAGASRL